MADHFAIWRTAHPNFVCTVLEAYPGLDLGDGKVKYSVRTSNKGTFTNDLPSVSRTIDEIPGRLGINADPCASGFLDEGEREGL